MILKPDIKICAKPFPLSDPSLLRLLTQYFLYLPRLHRGS